MAVTVQECWSRTQGGRGGNVQFDYKNPDSRMRSIASIANILYTKLVYITQLSRLVWFTTIAVIVQQLWNHMWENWVGNIKFDYKNPNFSTWFTASIANILYLKSSYIIQLSRSNWFITIAIVVQQCWNHIWENWAESIKFDCETPDSRPWFTASITNILYSKFPYIMQLTKLVWFITIAAIVWQCWSRM